MEKGTSFSTRWKNIEPSKTFVFWACIGSIVVTIFVGFKWGGWVTGGTADEMAKYAAKEARIELAVASCVVRYQKEANLNGRLAKLKKITSWERGTFLEKTGWVTPVGAEEPVSGAGGRCAEQLLTP